MNAIEYPPDTKSLATVEFVDGEVKVYPISAAASVSGHLAREMSTNGFLNLWVKGASVLIPREQVRTCVINDYNPILEN